MAATISDLANGTSITLNTTCVTGATVTANVGDWLVVIAASSNDGSGGAASQTGVVDSDGVNVYTQRAIINYDPGAAGAGATLGIYTCQVTQALSLDTVTVNHSGNTSEKGVQVYKLVPGDNEEIFFIVADTTGQTGNATSHAANTISVTSGDVIFGGAAIETDDVITGDADTTNGNWSAILSRLADNGADAATMVCSSQYKTVNATGNQDWACTSAARDSARAYLVLRSAINANNTIRFDAASNSGYKTATSPYSWSHTCTGSNRYLLVGVSMLSVAASSVSSITYNGVALTLLRARASAAGAIRSELWGLAAPAIGANNITVTLSAALDSIGNAVSLTGAHQTASTEAANDNSATNGGAPADATVDVTTLAAYDWVIDNAATDDTAITVGAGQTSRNNVTGVLGSGAMSTEGAKFVAGAVTMSWTSVAALATWSTAAVAVRPTSAAGLGFGPLLAGKRGVLIGGGLIAA